MELRTLMGPDLKRATLSCAWGGLHGPHGVQECTIVDVEAWDSAMTLGAYHPLAFSPLT